MRTFHFLVFLSVQRLINALNHIEMMELKENFWRETSNLISSPENVPSVLGMPSKCEGGIARVNGVSYDCEAVDFLSTIGRADMKINRKDFVDNIYEMSDIWGWLSPEGREITLVCVTNSLWFIDNTDPIKPAVLGYIESHRAESYWCDVKVYKDTAYIVQDRGGVSGGNDRGIQVFDLLRLQQFPAEDANIPINFQPDFTYAEHGAVHNVVIDTDTGFLYNVGTSGGEDCDGGLHIVDLSNRLEPKFGGCAAEDGYVHDAQCLVYTGPDVRYFSRELCFGYNEDTLTIYDVSDKQNPLIISKTTYSTARYTHQGWLNADQDFLLLNDEADEGRGGLRNTRTYIVNVTELDNPKFTGYFDHKDSAIDHNLYFWGELHRRGWAGNPPISEIQAPSSHYAYCANYAAGLRIIDTSNIKDVNPMLTEAGFFDVSPDFSSTEFYGAWSTYMHPSGVIAVSTIETGVMFLNFTQAFVDPISNRRDEVEPTPGTPEPRQEDEDDDDDDGGISNVALFFFAFCWVFVILFIVLCIAWQLRKRKLGAQTLIASRLSSRPEMPNRTRNPAFQNNQEVSV